MCYNIKLFKMEALYSTPRELFPGILLDKESGKFKIYGISCPSNAFEFYDPLFKWFDQYLTEPLENTVLDFNLTYFNTSTAKFLFILMNKFVKLSRTGKDVKIRWFYNEVDDDMKEEGEEFEKILDLKFEYISIDSEADDSEDDDYFDSIMDDTI